MRDQFLMVLPSNSSAKYFPENTTSSFNTKLPLRVKLEGQWEVSLSEIQFPYNFLHIRDKEGITFHYYGYIADSNAKNDPDIILEQPRKHYIDLHVETGVYYDIQDLIDAINAKCEKQRTHVKFTRDIGAGGKIIAELVCSEKECALDHYVYFSDKLERVLGFDTRRTRPELLKYDLNKPDEIADFPAWFLQKEFRSLPLYSITYSRELVSDLPPSLARAIPDKLFIYSDVCEPYITGDGKTSLLRIVSVDTSNRDFGSCQSIHFSSGHYIPLHRTDFQTIEIDIRDQLGEHIPFEFGTLTVTLHFRRYD